MAKPLQKLMDRLTTSFEEGGSAAEGKSPSKDFFEIEKSKEEIFRLFDRSSYVSALKSFENKDLLIKDRVANKSPVEFMAGLERDTRARFGSRLDNYRSAALTKRMPVLFFEQYRSMIERVSA